MGSGVAEIICFCVAEHSRELRAPASETKSLGGNREERLDS